MFIGGMSHGLRLPPLHWLLSQFISNLPIVKRVGDFPKGCNFSPSPLSTANMCKDCDFSDKSMNFCTQLGDTIRMIFGYRDIAYSSREKNGYRFLKNGCHWLSLSWEQ